MYVPLIRFLLPLVLTEIIHELSRQVLNGGMARMPQATETLASYGLAWGITMFLAGSLAQTRQLSLVLVDGRSALRKIRYFVAGAGLTLAVVLMGLATTPAGVWVIEDLHGVGPDLGAVVREALFWLAPVPVIDGIIRSTSGLLVRIRRTAAVSYAMVSNMAMSIAAVFALLPLGLIQTRPILLPLFVTYAGMLTELVVILTVYRRYAGQIMEEVSHASSRQRRPLTFGYILCFYWPLAFVMAVQGGSRPLINLFVARGADGTEALAVLTIVYALAHLPYGWLNEIRNLPAAFQHVENSLRHIRRFALGCGLLSFFTMALLFWTPVRVYILETLIGVDPGFATQCAVPLILFSFFPLTVMVRAYLHGIGLLEHRTRALAPSAPSRLFAIVVMLSVLPEGGLSGATRGVASLLGGFILETLVVWYALYGRRRQGRRDSKGTAYV